MISLGFSGTQHGMTIAQASAMSAVLESIHIVGPFEVHLGDCIGSDEQMRKLVADHGGRTVGHPPTDPKKRAFGRFDEERKPETYLHRNTFIVLEGVNGLLATPGSDDMPASLHGQGTWWTISRAVACRPLFVVTPGGDFWTP